MMRPNNAGRRTKRCIWLLAPLVVSCSCELTVGQESKKNAPTPDSVQSRSAPEVESLNRYFADKVFLLVEDFGKFTGSVEMADRVVIPLKQLRGFLQRELTQSKNDSASNSVTAVDLEGFLLGDRVEVKAIVAVQTGNPNAKISLDMREAQCQMATLDSGELAVLEKEIGGGFQVAIAKPGSHTLTLQLSLDALRSPLGRRAALTLPPAAVKLAIFRSAIPLARANTPNRDRPIEFLPDRKGIKIAPRSDESIDFAWRTTADVDPLEAAGSAAKSEVGVRINDSTVETTTIADLTLPTPISQLKFEMSAADRVVGIEAESNGNPVAFRRTTALEGKEREITLEFIEKFAGLLRLRTTAQRPLATDNGNDGVGRLVFRGLDRQEGVIRIESVRNRPTRYVPTGSAFRLPTVAWDQESTRRKIQALFRFDLPPAGIAVFCPSIHPSQSGRTETAVTLASGQIQLRSKLHVTIRNGAMEQLRIAVPARLENLEIAPNEILVVQKKINPPNAETAEISLALPDSTSGDVDLTLSGTLSKSSAPLVRLPMTYLLDDPNGQAEATFTADENSEFAFDAVESKHVIRLRSVPANGDAATRSVAYKAESLPATIAFQAKILALRREATIATTIRFETDVAIVRTIADIKFNRDSMDSITVQLPADAKNASLKLDDRPMPGGAKPGTNVVELSELTGACKIGMEYRTARPTGSSFTLALPRLQVDRVSNTELTVLGAPNESFVLTPPWRRSEKGRNSTANRPWENDTGTPEGVAIEVIRSESDAGAWIPAREALLILDEAGTLRMRFRYLIAEVRGNPLRIQMQPECSDLRCYLDGREVALSPTTERLLAIEIPIDGEAHAMELHYVVTLPRSFGILEEFAIVHHRFLDGARMGTASIRACSVSNRLCLGRDCGVDTTENLPARLWRRIFGSKLSGRDLFESLGLRPNWPADSEVLGMVPEGYRNWSASGYGDERATTRIVAIYEPMWILLCSGSVVAFSGWLLRISRPRRAIALIGAIVLGTTIGSGFPDFAWPAVKGGAWGIAFVLLVFVIRRVSKRPNRQWQRRPITSVITARPGSSLHSAKAVGSQPSLHRRVASTVDAPINEATPNHT